MSDLLDSLAGEGAVAAQGVFQLDQAKAREKMEQFQLVDPYHYVLELVQAAHLLGAKQIEFTIDTDELEMRFDGDGLAYDELEDVYSAAFSREPDERVQAMRHIAIALTAIGGLRPAEVRLTMPAGKGECVELLMHKGEETVSKVSPRPFPSQNRFYMKEKARIGHLIEFFGTMGGNHREVALIKQRCTYASSVITVNGERIARGHHLSPQASFPVEVHWKFDDARAKRPKKATSRDDRGLLGLKLDALSNDTVPSEVRLVQNGVWITSVSLDTSHVAVEAVFETSRLTKNLSQSAFVEDDAFRTLMTKVLREAMYESMFEWAKGVAVSSSNYGALRGIATNVWRDVSSQRYGSKSAASRLATTLERLPLWPTACVVDAAPDVFSFGSAQMVHLRALKEGAEPHAPFLYAQRRFHSVKNKRPVFLRRADTEEAFKVIGKYARRDWKSADKLLRTHEVRERNAQRWTVRQWSDPERSMHPNRATFEMHGMQVELYSMLERPRDVELVHVHEGRVLNSGRIPKPLPSAMVVIKGSFHVNDTFDAPMRTKELEEVYREIILRLPQVWHDLATDADLVRQPRVQEVLGAATYQLVTGVYANFALEAFGFVDDVAETAMKITKSESTPELVRLGGHIGSYTAERIDQRLEVLGPLASARYVPTAFGPKSLAELRPEKLGDPVWTGNLAVLPKLTAALRTWEGGIIVSEDHPWGPLIHNMFGNATDAIHHLERADARVRYHNRPAVQIDLLLAQAHYLLRGVVEGPGWRARWRGWRSAVSRARCQFLYDERVLENRTISRPFGSIDIVVDGNKTLPNATFEELEDESWVPTMLEEVEVHFLLAIYALAERAHDPEQQGISAEETQFLWGVMADAFLESDELATEPFARDTAGRTYSAHDLGQMARDHKLYWVYEGQNVLHELVPSGVPVIEVPRNSVVEHLERIAVHPSRLVDVTASEVSTRRLEFARADFYRRKPRAMELARAIMTHTQRHDGATVLAGLLGADGEDNTASTVVVCRERREVARQQVTFPFGRYEVVYNDDDLALDANWDHPLSISQAIDAAWSAAEQVVVDFLDAHGDHATSVVRERAIMWARIALAHEQSNWERWPQAMARLMSFPLFNTPGHGFASIDDLRAQHQHGSPIRYLNDGESTAGVGRGFVMVSGHALLLLDHVFGDALVHARSGNHQPTEPQPEPPSSEPPAPVAEDMTDIVPVWEIDPAAAAEIDEPPRRITPEELVVDGVRHFVRQVSERTDEVLESKYTEEIQLWGNDPKRVARVTADKVSIMADHVITGYALDAPDDPIRRAFLASGVLTVINHHYEEVDENDEVHLQQQVFAAIIEHTRESHA
jgi:hypothetical protein